MSKEKESFPAYRRRVDRDHAYAVVTLADERSVVGHTGSGVTELTEAESFTRG